MADNHASKTRSFMGISANGSYAAGSISLSRRGQNGYNTYSPFAQKPESAAGKVTGGGKAVMAHLMHNFYRAGRESAARHEPEGRQLMCDKGN